MNKKFAGVLLICDKTRNFLLLERSNKASYPKTWSVVAGGVEEYDESTVETVKRELKEETQIDPSPIKFKFFEHQDDISNFDFYLGYCEEEYECKLDHENDDWGWFNMDNLPQPLFPTLYSSLVRIF